MSNTALKDAYGVIEWIQQNNGFWNSDLLEVKQSKFGGVGVFAKQDIDPSLQLTVLLRLHKNSILSAKTTHIANLLTEDEIDGALSLIVAFIYEKEAGKSSPWYSFIKSIKYKDSNDNLILPPSLWNKKEKSLLKGTELETMGALDDSENQIQFERACQFALNHFETSNGMIKIPWEFDINNQDEKDLLLKYETFIAISHAVASRDFEIDEYHEVALVPGACLFNHRNKPTVRFESLFDVCGACGESNCDHVADSDDEDEEHDEDEEEDEDIEEHQHQHQESDDDEGDDENDEDMRSESEEEEEFEGPIEEFVEMIEEAYQLEQESEQLEKEALERLRNGEMDEEVSEEESENKGPILFEDDDKLISPDDCCDIVLTKKVKKGDELFNTYGDFNNSVLLSKYGFVIPDNSNDTVGLGFQFIRLKKQNKKLYSRQFDWWESKGYPAMREMFYTKKNECEDDCCSNENKSSCQNDCCDHEHDDHGDEHDHDGPEEEVPHWTMEVELQHSGESSPITYALLKLLSLNKLEITKFLKNPEKVNLQVLTTKSSKALKILQEIVEKRSKEYNNDLNLKKLSKSKNQREQLAAQLIKDEQEIITRSLKYISKKI